MAILDIRRITVETEGKTVVSDASLRIKSGELHILMGPNGSGKSSFLNALMGHPAYALRQGTIHLDEEDITALPTEKKARAGLFLSPQHVPEIHGVTLTNFLHRAYKEIKQSNIAPFDFYQMMEKKTDDYGINPSFLKKYVNSGLSGGERKQSEVIQLAALEPRFAFLDEIDSGVDIDALKKVFSVIEKLRAQGVGFLLVTHFSNILTLLVPDCVHIMKEGKFVSSGGKELIEHVTAHGFDSIV